LEDVLDALAGLLWMGALLDLVDPLEGLAIEVVQGGEDTGGEETLADETDGFLDPTFFVRTARPTRPGLEVIMGAELE
jgi:hypothetical protein